MFEFLFKYPASVFAKGNFVLQGVWPVWALFVLIAAGALLLAYLIFIRPRRDGTPIHSLQQGAVWILQSLFLALLLFILWQPAISVAMLRPQQNILAVILDDSRSMAVQDEGSKTRHEAMIEALGSIVNRLQSRFQVRLYRAGATVTRIAKADQTNASLPATRLGDALQQVAAEASSLPIGSILLLSDGADNAGGIGLNTLDEIRRRHIPVSAIGFGKENPAHDIEVVDAQVPPRTLANSRLSASVSLRQYGYAGGKAQVFIKDGSKVLAMDQVQLSDSGSTQIVTLAFNAGPAGARNVQIGVQPLSGEENLGNNSVTRLIAVENNKPRILYVEGEPRWEYKFLMRAADLDKSISVTTMLRTTQNKVYRQGIQDPKELEEGFPAKVDELFGFQGLILGGVEANYFTSAQQELIRQFVDRRGGGILFLAGRFGLGDGGYAQSGFADLLPTILPNRPDTFQRDPAQPQLTNAGRDSLLCRIEDNPEKNVERWKHLPYLANYQDAGTPKPGAAVLAEMTAGSRKLPMLVTETFGRGRSALMATSGTWRWQMAQPLADMSHETFWQQMLRWICNGTYGRVIASTPKSVFSDETRIPLHAEVRDKNYLPESDAKVEAHILGPDGLTATLDLHPEPLTEGQYAAEYGAERAGNYVVEISAKHGVEEAVTDAITFRREDGVAENFHTQQNRELLEKLASQTGGHYYRASETSRLADEISYSEAGISARETRDLWDMPVLFLLAIALRSSEWLLRRKWGVV